LRKINYGSELNKNRHSQTPTVCDHYAGSLRFAEKALQYQTEVGPKFEITLDLEDGAKRGGEEKLADEFIEIITSKKNSFRKTGLRLPEYRHPLFEKIASRVLSTISPILHHLTIPKIKDSDEYFRIRDLLTNIISVNNTSLPPLRILFETHSIFPDLDVISKDPSVQSIELGIMDFISSMNGIIPMDECRDLHEFNNPLINHIKSLLSLGAARNKKLATHNVCREYKNEKVIRQFCIKAKSLGFGRMWSIHPNQIPVILEVFTPSRSEITEACAILQKAMEHDWAPIAYDSTLHDGASYRYYYALLQRAETLQVPLPVPLTHFSDNPL
jgi:citrate lyase subunit beta / citryl-CoA lyase